MRSLQKSTRILSCGIYRTTAPGVEVRAGYSDDDLLRSQRTAEIGSARQIAEAWRQAVIPKGRARATSRRGSLKLDLVHSITGTISGTTAETSTPAERHTA
jgi:hypothetical protein